MENLKPGRELDALIAEKVMNLPNVEKFKDAFGVEEYGSQTRDGFFTGIQSVIPHFSTDIAAAWEVVEKMKATNHSCFLSTHISDVHMANFVYGKEPVGGDTLPHAICLAALKAVGL